MDRSPAPPYTPADAPTPFSVGRTPEGYQFLVPTFLKEATEVAFQSDELKNNLDTHQAPGRAYTNDAYYTQLIDAGKVMSPAVPPLTQRELLALHAEVQVLQQRYGMSYKDAAHWLYLSETRKLRAVTNARDSIGDLCDQADCCVEKDLQERLLDVENSSAPYSGIPHSPERRNAPNNVLRRPQTPQE